MSMSRAPLWLFLLVASVTIGVLIYNTRRERWDSLSKLEYSPWVDGEVYSMASWRFWDDMYVGISRYLDWSYGPTRRSGNPDEDIERFKELVIWKAGEEGIHPMEFWRAIRPDPFLRVRHQTWIPPLEDPGRPILLGAAFTLRRGIAPYLLIWIGTLASLPAFLWILWEARASGVFLAGGVLVALSVSSPFVVESLSLAHSAVAFYLIAALLLVALGVYAFLGRDRSSLGFVIRAAAASLGFALCCVCRAGTLLMAPAFAAALFVAFGRSIPIRAPDNVGRRCLLAGLLTAAFVAPYLVVRPPQHHNFWMSYWQGLADYGAERGYSWHDRDLKRWLVARGRKPFEHPRDVSRDDDAYMGEAVRSDIRADPSWFAVVLGRRFVDTVSLAKLAPYGPRDGYSIEPPPLHYKYTTPADWFGFGRWKLEVRTIVLWSGSVILLLWWVHAALRSEDAWKRYLEDRLSLILALAAATLALPVLMTTAAGMETQTFVLVHFLSFSFLVQAAADWAVERLSALRSHAHP
jgi:hypothetical protein